MSRAGVTPERLVRAGADLADEVGFDQVTVSALARQFDVKVPSLYAHVEGSRDLRTRIALLALDELADLSAAALAGPSRTAAQSALGDADRDYAPAHPGRDSAPRLRHDPATSA
ncbi:TetR family transcriptional regulator, partial [Actinoplanes sp. NPDC048791]|uniref:TetR/AcrR family transcriptional regulator n=1 Tax=Actinoplanes sp. NPDC048791 TaxID=3154623 RepID=UPI00340067CF